MIILAGMADHTVITLHEIWACSILAIVFALLWFVAVTSRKAETHERAKYQQSLKWDVERAVREEVRKQQSEFGRKSA